ncbi:unnamed protein product [Thlaspi arvense]|uniref:CCHC-type domain-containing protein n=1 Tax=Thlaspi arvense TaxID=13288 RepID=A0AAU9RH88_THLAR|nr:unnamed protein product [Thlaspi arvense]
MTQSETVALKETGVSPPKLRSETTVPTKFTVLKPKNTSPLTTNNALNFPRPPNPITPAPLSAVAESSFDLNVSPTQTVVPPVENKSANSPTLAERIRVFEDRSLCRVASVSFTDSGRPTVLIPDEVFKKGEELHKDFIVCYFNGRAPSYSKIQSVLNHMWGKGGKLEIHNNPLARNMIVRITSDYLRTKILEKDTWYNGDSLFRVAQWTSEHSGSSRHFESMQIWAYLTGVPLDLRHQKGLSFVAGLVGERKETDEFTKNLVSLTMSHVKVEVNLTKELPRVVEFTRQSGEVVEVLVDYPWLPPTCSHCKELGHIARNCLLLPPPPKSADPASKRAPKLTVSSTKAATTSTNECAETSLAQLSPKDHVENVKVTSEDEELANMEVDPKKIVIPHLAPASVMGTPLAALGDEIDLVTPTKTKFPNSSSLPPLVPIFTPFVIALPATITPTGEPYLYSPPENPQKAILKRTRSHPSLNTVYSTPSSNEPSLRSPINNPLSSKTPTKSVSKPLSNSVTSFEDSPYSGKSAPPS